MPLALRIELEGLAWARDPCAPVLFGLLAPGGDASDPLEQQSLLEDCGSETRARARPATGVGFGRNAAWLDPSRRARLSPVTRPPPESHP